MGNRKLKVIFLDIDGVLNGYSFMLDLLYKLSIKFNKRKWFKEKYPFSGIHESKVALLSKIVKKTGAVCVLNSSISHLFFPRNNVKSEIGESLNYLFDKYNINIIGTSFSSKSRENGIYEWLSKHENEIYSYVIIDDEVSFYDLLKDRLVQTSSIKSSEIIMGKLSENTGLKRKHVRKAIKILNKNIREV